MAERDGAAVDVDPCRVEGELADGREHDDGEGPPFTSKRSMSPVASPVAASTLRTETLFSVSAPWPRGMPAPSPACRAGACPSPAAITLPMITCSTASAGTPARATAARSAAAPSLGAESEPSVPPKPPMGVHAAPTR